MLENELFDYMNKAKVKGLSKIEVTLEAEPELIQDDFNVIKTKETYTFESEGEADGLINAMRQIPGFVGCDKKFKAGKVNKSGETLREDQWIVTIKLNH